MTGDGISEMKGSSLTEDCRRTAHSKSFDLKSRVGSVFFFFSSSSFLFSFPFFFLSLSLQHTFDDWGHKHRRPTRICKFELYVHLAHN